MTGDEESSTVAAPDEASLSDGDCAAATGVESPEQLLTVVQGQHRAVSPGDVTKTPHVVTVFWFNPLPGICGSPSGLGGA